MIDCIKEYRPHNTQEEIDQAVMLDLYQTYGDSLFERSNKVAHFTASSLIFDKELKHMIMIYHNIYQSYSWTGGHNDGDRDFYQVALKESSEETGIPRDQFVPLGLEPSSIEILTVKSHIKRGQFVNSHLHLNVTYLFLTDYNHALATPENEAKDIQWIDVDKVLETTNEADMRPIYEKNIQEAVKRFK